MLGGLEGGLEVLFCAYDRGALGGGGEKEVDGCEEGFVERGGRQSEGFEGGKEGGNLVMRRVCGGSDDEKGVQGREDGEVMVKGGRRRIGQGEGGGLEDLEGLGKASGALVNNTFEVKDQGIEVVWDLRLQLGRCFFQLTELILGLRPGCSST